ncbi:MAG: phosphoribosyltransferase [Candidatus Neomarinimicrobiota bacterium]
MVFIEPPASRKQLEWSRFSQKDDGSWCFNLETYYANLFEIQKPGIMAKSNTGWRTSRSGKTIYAFFLKLNEVERAEIEEFRAAYAGYVVIGLNKNLRGFSKYDLSGCLALGYNLHDPKGKHTELGKLEYDAKYNKSEEAFKALASFLASAVHCIPGINNSPSPRFLTSIPSSDANPSAYCLPRLLCAGIISSLDKSIFSNDTPFVQTSFRVQKRKLKGLSLAQKRIEWSRILQNRGIQLSRTVKNATVLIVDDLYQSGTTIWNMAKYLKEVEGATEIFGLVCVKSLRDTANR